MDEKDKIVEIKEHKDFKYADTQSRGKSACSEKTTNPIHNNFIKYLKSSRGKFSIKDIFR